MFNQADDRPMTSQFALRVAVLGGIAFVVFAAIFFRLWFLEVLSGEAYLKEANANRVREITVQAPRGEILDRKGRVLVDNQTVLSLQVQPDKLCRNPKARERELQAARPRLGDAEGQDQEGDPRADQPAAGEPGDAAAERRPPARLLPARAPGRVPRRHRR